MDYYLESTCSSRSALVICCFVYVMRSAVHLIEYYYLFSHLVPGDYGPKGMYRSDPGLQSIQLDWSKGMLVRVQTVFSDYLDS